jgi:septum formation protein
MSKKCILGSQSPRRQELLTLMGFPFEVRVSDVEENFPDDMNVRLVAEFLAIKKASSLLPTLLENEILLTADSTVICNDAIYNKPVDEDDAVRILQELSGKRHEVITGVWIGDHQNFESFSEITEVTFASLSTEEIKFYIKNYKPFDKAGAYGIQDWFGLTSVTSIRGSYTNVMGLPTHMVYERLKKHFI